jgi:hypothetical protein
MTLLFSFFAYILVTVRVTEVFLRHDEIYGSEESGCVFPILVQVLEQFLAVRDGNEWSRGHKWK